MEIKGKKVLVMGLARSGLGASNILAKLEAEVTVTDIKPIEAVEGYVKRLLPSVRHVLGGHPGELFRETDMIVLSPGISLDNPHLQDAIKLGMPIISELELAYGLTDAPFIAITGTNGKSTTTTLVAEMLKLDGRNIILGGNIGNALTEEIYMAVNTQKTIDFIVAEVSSFQLETIKEFRPKIAAILNITPDHMDRYHYMDAYIKAKERIFENQTSDDFLVLNADDPEINEVRSKKLEVRSVKPQILFFSRFKEVKGVYFKNGVVYCNIPDLSFPGHLPLIDADDIRIKGVHNLENAMAASLIAILCGCRIKAIRDTLVDFKGLEHRLEFVDEMDGVTYINDSKGTNIGAVMKSLEGFESPIILLAGGRDKDGDFSLLRGLVEKKVKTLILFGEAKDKISKAIGDATDTIMADTLKDAVEIARNQAERGDVVLLSPACASFDMFSDFEDRGRKFKEIVRGQRVRS